MAKLSPLCRHPHELRNSHHAAVLHFTTMRPTFRTKPGEQNLEAKSLRLGLLFYNNGLLFFAGELFGLCGIVSIRIGNVEAPRVLSTF